MAESAFLRPCHKLGYSFVKKRAEMGLPSVVQLIGDLHTLEPYFDSPWRPDAADQDDIVSRCCDLQTRVAALPALPQRQGEAVCRQACKVVQSRRAAAKTPVQGQTVEARS